MKFTKNDLEDRMLIQTDDDSIGFIAGGSIYYTSHGGCEPLDWYNDDLIHKGISRSIVKVWAATDNFTANGIKQSTSREPLWERTEDKEKGLSIPKLSKESFSQYISDLMKARTASDAIVDAMFTEVGPFAETFVDNLIVNYVLLLSQLFNLDEHMETEFMDWCITDNFDREKYIISFSEYRDIQAREKLSVEDVYNILVGDR